MSDLTIHDAPISPKVKKAPSPEKLGLELLYSPSGDGIDENLLILFHGLGDTHIPFYKLGRSLNLPQTAVLAIRAPERIPYLEDACYQWFPSFDELGLPVRQPNPTHVLTTLTDMLHHLVDDCFWPIDRIHAFGFGQGASVALELAIKWSKERPGERSQRPQVQPSNMATIVTICGPLLSYPTTQHLLPTSVLLVNRKPPAESALPKDAIQALRKAFANVQNVDLDGRSDGMPSCKEDWMHIMRFWSENLSRRKWEGWHEVISSASGPGPILT